MNSINSHVAKKAKKAKKYAQIHKKVIVRIDSLRFDLNSILLSGIKSRWSELRDSFGSNTNIVTLALKCNGDISKQLCLNNSLIFSCRSLPLLECATCFVDMPCHEHRLVKSQYQVYPAR